ncbi:hypothetical protein D3C72_2008540 [compost metagenome]
MNRIDLEHRWQVQGFEHTAGLHIHRMGRSVLHGQVRVIGLTVIEEAGKFMDFLMQAATERHVHFLEAAADAEHRNAGSDGCADQWQGGAVPLRIVFRTGGAVGALIVEGFHVRRRPGQQQTVELRQQVIDFGQVA